ncbi:hypothetical protein SNEBB_006285 [Seison nebaliae]|nr:hypothetical protein SNEBB_006285 [Seison nebaliae]
MGEYRLLAKQENLVHEQDLQLEQLGTTVASLKNKSELIGNELDDQAENLQSFSNDMGETETKLETNLRKLSKLTRISSDRRQWYVIGGLVILIIITLIFIFT